MGQGMNLALTAFYTVKQRLTQCCECCAFIPCSMSSLFPPNLFLNSKAMPLPISRSLLTQWTMLSVRAQENRSPDTCTSSSFWNKKSALLKVHFCQLTNYAKQNMNTGICVNKILHPKIFL